MSRVLRRTVVSDWRFDNLCGSHLQSQVVALVSWKFKNPGERFDWSVDRVAVGKCVIGCKDMCGDRLCTTNWLWSWLSHRLSKRQSLTTVLRRTPPNQIFFNQGMLLLGSNHFLSNLKLGMGINTLFHAYWDFHCDICCLQPNARHFVANQIGEKQIHLKRTDYVQSELVRSIMSSNPLPLHPGSKCSLQKKLSFVVRRSNNAVTVPPLPMR